MYPAAVLQVMEGELTVGGMAWRASLYVQEDLGDPTRIPRCHCPACIRCCAQCTATGKLRYKERVGRTKAGDIRLLSVGFATSRLA